MKMYKMKWNPLTGAQGTRLHQFHYGYVWKHKKFPTRCSSATLLGPTLLSPLHGFCGSCGVPVGSWVDHVMCVVRVGLNIAKPLWKPKHTETKLLLIKPDQNYDSILNTNKTHKHICIIYYIIHRQLWGACVTGRSS